MLKITSILATSFFLINCFHITGFSPGNRGGGYRGGRGGNRFSGGSVRGGRIGDSRGGDRKSGGGPPSRGGRGGFRGGRGGGRGGGAGDSFKSGKKVEMVPHRFDGVFIAKGKDDALVTLSLVPGVAVYGEKRITVEVNSLNFTMFFFT